MREVFFDQKGEKDSRITNAPNPVSDAFITENRDQLLDACKYESSFGLSR